ncbi:ribosome biogenesis/translation initiation ATPase RLI [Candidatus Woesearchaeota archaeon]|nr:ribosome biogenesis/translation initiation ATPase RLI [Candidatus Woesearchaeota archaeon]
MRKRIAVIDREKCHPDECGNYLCAKLCPVNRAGADCIYPGDDPGKKARIDEMLCTGCQICPKRCPFGAISIINLPEQLDGPPVHRYGENLFELYSLPTPIFGQVTGILGKNGLGKSTAIKILANIVKPNLGKWQTPAEFKEVLQYFKGKEIQKFLEQLQLGKISLSYKPQQVDLIPKQFSGTVRELLEKVDKQGNLPSIAEKLQLTHFLDTSVAQISGGELQRVAIAATVLKGGNLFLFDEPSSYLDIKQRINISGFITSLATAETAVITIEHDLVILDYMTEYLNIMYGHEGVFGVVSGVKSTREGINAFLDGYLKEENMRFRDHALKFDKTQDVRFSAPKKLISWKKIEKKLGNFHLSTEEGSLYRNEIIGMLGENGMGKTSFVKMLAGVLQSDSGELDTGIKVSYKPQYLETSSEMLVGEFLQRAVQKYQHQLVGPLDVEKLFSQKLSELSGGQLQRVAIVKCLAEDADLFLLDEPSAYLDVEQRLLISKVIKNLAREREVSVLVVDHDLLFLDYLSDRLLVFSGTPAREGVLRGPFSMTEGMNLFLKELDITLRRDHTTFRPRINKKDSVKDREQRAEGKWYGG